MVLGGTQLFSEMVMSHNLHNNLGNWCIFPENLLIYQGKLVEAANSLRRRNNDNLHAKSIVPIENEDYGEQIKAKTKTSSNISILPGLPATFLFGLRLSTI